MARRSALEFEPTNYPLESHVRILPPNDGHLFSKLIERLLGKRGEALLGKWLVLKLASTLEHRIVDHQSVFVSSQWRHKRRLSSFPEIHCFSFGTRFFFFFFYPDYAGYVLFHANDRPIRRCEMPNRNVQRQQDLPGRSITSTLRLAVTQSFIKSRVMMF